jgi:hypothetical protein
MTLTGSKGAGAGAGAGVSGGVCPAAVQARPPTKHINSTIELQRILNDNLATFFALGSWFFVLGSSFLVLRSWFLR